MEKKKWSKITTPWAFADALFNQLTITRVTRPWDYSILVVVRALHCARWLGEIEQDEAKQTELLLQFYLDIMEKNINKARASKPPCTFEETWSVLRHSVQRAQKSPDMLMSGNCYSAVNKNLQSKFKERGVTVDKMSKEVKELKQEIKTLKASLADSKRRGGRSSDSNTARAPKQSTSGGLIGGARTLKQKVDGETRGLEFLNGNFSCSLKLFHVSVRLLSGLEP